MYDVVTTLQNLLLKYASVTTGDTVAFSYLDKSCTYFCSCTIVDMLTSSQSTLMCWKCNQREQLPSLMWMWNWTLFHQWIMKTNLRKAKKRTLGTPFDLPLVLSPLFIAQNSLLIQYVPEMEGVQYAECKRCKRKLPAASLALHEARCKEWRCDLCMKPIFVPQETHFAEVHAQTTCKCGASLERWWFFFSWSHLHFVDNTWTITTRTNVLLGAHCDLDSSPDLFHRRVYCKYCEFPTKASELQAHEEQCGNKTDRCTMCHAAVPRKEKQFHKEICPAMDHTVTKNTNNLLYWCSFSNQGCLVCEGLVATQ